MRVSICLATLVMLVPVPSTGAQAPSAAAEVTAETAATARPRLSRLQGRASLGRNRHVVGATVLVRPEADRSRLFVTSSDARGQFHVDELPDGQYHVEMRREGLVPVVKSNVGLRFPFRAVVEVAMRPVGSSGSVRDDAAGSRSGSGRVQLAGRISRADGSPLPEAQVRLVRPDGKADPRQRVSAADGSFDLADLTAGSWRVEVRGVGFLPIRTGVELTADTELRIAMVKQPASYDPSPLELMPPEQPIPPAAFDGAAGAP